MMYLGDYLEDATVYIPFTTNAADGGRESFSATLEEADIVILKNGAAMTLDASTITISLDLGSRVGFHVVAVDMSNDADFTTGADYAAMLYASDETLDAQAPAGVLATWSCENRVVDVARMNGSDITKSSDNRLQVDIAEWNDIPLATTNPLPNAAADAAGGLPISDAGGLDLDAQFAKLGTITDLGNGATIGANLSDMAGATFSTTTDSQEALRNRGDAAWITATGFSTLVATDILSDGTALNTTSGALDNVTLVDTTTTNSDMRGTDSAATASALATVDTVVDTILATVRITTGSVTTGITPTATNFTTTLTAANDAYNDLLIRFTSGTLSGQVMPIDLYENSGGEITLAASHEAFTAAPSNGDTFDILPYHVHPISQIVNAQYDQDTTENVTVGSRGKQLNDLVATIAALNDLSAAEVNAEVVDALNVDTYAEPGQGTPAATASLVYKIGLLYKALRNKSTQDASTYELYNDDATTVDQKATVSDDGTDFTRGEITTGP